MWPRAPLEGSLLGDVLRGLGVLQFANFELVGHPWANTSGRRQEKRPSIKVMDGRFRYPKIVKGDDLWIMDQ